MLQGIDVWNGNGIIGWAKVKAAGQAFVFTRAAYGDVEDKRVAGNLDGIRQAGLAAGVYQFLRTCRSYQAQIDLMMALIDRLDIGAGDLPPVLDIEDNPQWDGPWLKSNNDKYLTAVALWVDAVRKRLGTPPILYTRAGFWETLGNPTGLHDCPLWVAHYGALRPRLPAGWTDYALWQYSETGAVPGVQGHVDMNRFNGDHAALDALRLK